MHVKASCVWIGNVGLCGGEATVVMVLEERDFTASVCVCVCVLIS